MTELQVRLFATLKDRAGGSRIAVPIATPTTVDKLCAVIGTRYPALAPSLASALVAVNREYAFGDTEIREGDEIAIFPPVSGGEGSFPHPVMFAVTTEAVDLNDIAARLTGPDVGAVIFFHGSVRGATARSGLPAETDYLEYEAYEDMALRKMAQIAHEIWGRWPLVRGVAIVQRIGRLEVGETTTLVACAAGHRDQGAFEAARYGIDRLKQIVPVWKKEVGSDQSVWIEGDYRPTSADVPSNVSPAESHER